MNSSRESGIAIIIFLIIATAIMVGLMCSCKTKETVTEIVTVHDTLREVKTDTVRDVRVVTQKDSTHHETERIVTIKENGDTLRIENNTTIIREIQRTDSLDRYRHVCDSLKAALSKASEKEKIVVKKQPYVPAWLVCVMLSGLAIGFLGGWLRRNRSIRRRDKG